MTRNRTIVNIARMPQDVSAALVERILVDGERGRETPAEPLLDRARRNKLAATLLSIQERDGVLEATQARELDAYRSRAERYRGLERSLSEVADVTSIKGFHVARSYPPGVDRQSRDLDLVGRTPDDVWAAAGRLAADGWEVVGLVLVPLAGELHPVVELEVEREGSTIGPDAVHLTSLEWDGSVWKGVEPAPRVRAGSAPSQLVDLLQVVSEALQRDVQPRDVLDAHLLTQATDPEDVAAWRRLLDAHQLWPEWRAMQRRLARLGLLPPAFMPRREDRRRTARALLRRSRAAARIYLRPRAGLVAYAQARLYRQSRRKVDRYLISNAHRIAPAHAALRRGLPLLGVPMSDERTETSRPLERRGPILVLRSPAGTFGLVPGDFFDEEWLEYA